MSTFLYLMINSFIMLTQRKFIRFYTNTHTRTTHWFICIWMCVRLYMSASKYKYILQRKCSEKHWERVWRLTYHMASNIKCGHWSCTRHHHHHLDRSIFTAIVMLLCSCCCCCCCPMHCILLLQQISKCIRL